MRSVPSSAGWAEWLAGQMRTCGFDTDQKLADAIGVHNTTVSRWRKGTQPDVHHLRQLVEPLRTDFRQLLLVSDLLSEAELRGQVQRPQPLVTRDLLETDRGLSAEARRIMLAAYDVAVSAKAPSQLAAARRPRGGGSS